MLAVYAVVNGDQQGWLSLRTEGMLAGAVALLVTFLVVESVVRSPLMPLRVLRLRNVATANGVGILWAGAMFAWFVLSALYLQFVLGYGPQKVGLAFLPANLVMGVLSVAVSARLVMRFGIKIPLGAGLALAATGLLLFVRAPVHGSFLVDVLPSMLLLGIGAGIGFNPVFLAVMSDVEPHEAGLASGMVNTAFMMGGALGLAVLSSLAAARTKSLGLSGHGKLESLVGGYHLAFAGGALFALAAAVVGVTLLRLPHPGEQPAHGGELGPAEVAA
jgi:predicted MFS family arabinose efflux permease